MWADTNVGEDQIFILRTHNVFAQCFLRQNEVHGQINTLASAKSCQPVLSQSDVLSLEIEQPFDNAIAEFERIVFPLFEGIVNLSKQTASLAAACDMLPPMLMKGFNN